MIKQPNNYTEYFTSTVFEELDTSDVEQTYVTVGGKASPAEILHDEDFVETFCSTVLADVADLLVGIQNTLTLSGKTVDDTNIDALVAYLDGAFAAITA